MKGYVVTLMQKPESVEVAKRCIESAKQFDIIVEMFPAVDKDFALHELQKEGLKQAKFDETYSNPNAVLGNFISQYRIWNQIIKDNAPAIVLEHDAVFVSNLPDVIGKGDIINLGKPSYGKFQTKSVAGIYKMFSKHGGMYAPGAHGYYVTPEGAKQLISEAKKSGAAPCDLFLNNKKFPNIMESYPWPIEAHDEFTTIQVEKGCVAKHNYKQGKYKIL